MEINNRKAIGVHQIGKVDISLLQKKLSNLTDLDWDTKEDFEVNYNKQKSESEFKVQKALDSTKHIIFKFANKQKSPFEYITCSRWDKWSKILLPIMNEATQYLSYENKYFPKVMLANLPSQNFIRPHTDGDEKGFIPHKIHVPIQTNKSSFFFLESERFFLEQGIAYEVNNGRLHSVVNGGVKDRIHLIFECLDFDAQSPEIKRQMLNPITTNFSVFE